MHEGVLHIRDVEGPKKTGSVEARLEAMEQQVFKCQGMVERGLNAKHMMIREFTNKHKIHANDIGKHLSSSMTKLITSKPRSTTCKPKLLAMVSQRADWWDEVGGAEAMRDENDGVLQCGSA
ncbi:40S ribosomal protein S5-1 [Hordeum vulgare]|nr:40S ribosomal protein S5-1 [Hordeum vulgare]